MRKAAAIVLLLCLVLLANPFSTRGQSTNANLFPLKVGNDWKLQDQASGHITDFRMFALPTPGTGNSCCNSQVALLINKSFQEDYWNPGSWNPGCVAYGLRNDAGTIHSPGAVFYSNCFFYIQGSAWAFPAPSNTLLANLLNPIDVIVNYFETVGSGSACPTSNPLVHHWVTTWATQQVTGPVYSGPALCALVKEAPSSDPNAPFDAVENWCFASSGIGLVELDALVQPNGSTHTLKLVKVTLK